MTRAALLVAGVAASMSVAGTAAAWVPYRSTTGNFYRWPATSVPMVAYPDDLTAMMPLDEIRGALDASAAAWSAGDNPCTALQLGVTYSDAETPRAAIDNSNNIIFRTTSWCAQTETGECDPTMVPYEPAALALTSVSAGMSSGTIRDVDLEVNAVNFDWADLVLHPELIGMPIHDLQNAVTHEMGHAIGLNHTCYLDPPPEIDDMGQSTPDCANASLEIMATTMFPSANPGDLEMRTLADDDKQGLCALYPVDDGCGCAAAGATASPAVSLLALAVALAALRARRRAISRSRAKRECAAAIEMCCSPRARRR